jgi:beta-mannosidase
MKPLFTFITLLLFSAPLLGQGTDYPRKISLDGTWDYQPVFRTTLRADSSIEDTANMPAAGTMPVPSNWHLRGLANFNGRVRFTRDFDFAEKLAVPDRAFLVFHGVDYYAEVELNGARVGKHEGYFQVFEFEVTPQLKRGRNHLAVTVDAPLEEPGTVWPDHKRMIKGVLSHWDCKPGSVSQKFGQDGTTAGIWNSVELEIRHEAWLGSVKIQPFLYERLPASEKAVGAVAAATLAPLHESDGYDAKIFITAEVEAIKPGKYLLTAEAGGAHVSSELQLTTGRATAVLVLPMERPRLWWTWDLGEPYLYTAHLKLAANQEVLYTRELKFGVRRIELDEKTGEWRLNGVRFFIRGTNIVPELWLSAYSPERIGVDLKLLRDTHINGVRVCVHVNREELYDALDRAGIVAWQDFPLQWDYARTDEFMQEAASQLRDMIRQFYNHPSIITWVCQNESTSYNVNVLDPFLARVGSQEDSSRPVRPVSAFQEHIYEGWYGGDYHNYRTTPGGPIISELGAQALPSLEEMREMFGDAWPPDWEKLAYHDFQYQQTFKDAKLPMPSGWADFVANSQRYQAELLKFAIEHYRREKYKKVGSFFQFQFVDCWPAITWSVVSYARRPKPAYYALQRAFQPVLIATDLDKTVWSKGKSREAPVGLGLALKIWVVNDEHHSIEGATFEARLRRRGAEALGVGPIGVRPAGTAAQGSDVVVGCSLPAQAGKEPVSIAADTVQDLPELYCTLPDDVAPGGYELVLLLKQGDRVISENLYPISVVE